MKKFILIIIALVAMTCNANAQLNVVKTEKKTEIVSRGNNGALLLLDEKYGYVLAIVSSNRYDDFGMILIGDEIAGAIETLGDLKHLCDDIGDNIVTIEAYAGESCTIRKGLVRNSLRLDFKSNAGYSTLTNKDINIFINYLYEL